MNDFELSYMYYARSRELMAEAEDEREAKRARKASRDGRGGLVSRLAKAPGRKAGPARRAQLAK